MGDRKGISVSRRRFVLLPKRKVVIGVDGNGYMVLCHGDVSGVLDDMVLLFADGDCYWMYGDRIRGAGDNSVEVKCIG